jgi:hypothetical protein
MTLTQTAIVTKQFITLTVIALVLGLVSFIGYKIWYAYYLSHLPPVEEKPDTKFGQLPYPDFPNSSVSSSNYSYSVDTSTGNLPKVGIDEGFEKIIKVYFVTKTYATLLSGEKSKALAEKFDIKTAPQILSETSYLFEENSKSLVVDLDTGNFNYKNDATISGTESLEEDSKLVTDFERNLQELGVFKEDLKKSRTKVIHIRDIDRILAQVSLWPAPIDSKPVFTSEFDTSEIYARVYKSADNIKNYLQLNFNYFPIELSTYATYPIKTSEKAFEDLKGGRGAIVVEPIKPQVSITSIYLGYFLGRNYSPYLQPIFVFEGPHFAAYVPAISEEFQTLAR